MLLLLLSGTKKGSSTTRTSHLGVILDSPVLRRERVEGVYRSGSWAFQG